MSLYISTVFCQIIQLRLDGLRLRQDAWPAPVAGRLDMECMNATHTNFRRAMRQATLSTQVGVAQRWVKQLFLFEPVLLHINDDGFVLRGIQLKRTDAGIYEQEQMWLCLTSTHPTPSRFLATLPKTVEPRNDLDPENRVIS